MTGSGACLLMKISVLKYTLLMLICAMLVSSITHRSWYDWYADATTSCRLEVDPQVVVLLRCSWKPLWRALKRMEIRLRPCDGHTLILPEPWRSVFAPYVAHVQCLLTGAIKATRPTPYQAKGMTGRPVRWDISNLVMFFSLKQFSQSTCRICATVVHRKCRLRQS